MVLLRRTGSVAARTLASPTERTWTAWAVAMMVVVFGLTLIGQMTPRDARDDSRRISQAIADNDARVLGQLMTDGADPNGPDDCGNPPLTYAATFGETPVIRTLLDAGAAPDSRSIAGHTALGIAAGRGHLGVVEALLDGGADPNAADSSGRTPLMMAALAARIEVVELLLSRGADPMRLDEEGQSALWYAAATCVDDTRVTALLWRLCGGMDRRDDAGRNPLHEAAEHGHAEQVKWLLRAGVDVSTRDLTRRTPLDIAILRNDGNVTGALEAAGVTPSPVEPFRLVTDAQFLNGW